MAQRIYFDFLPFLEVFSGNRIFLVCGRSFDRLEISAALSALSAVRFSDFSANPVYEDICTGVRQFRESGCDAILAVGGGSAIDVAKCIKLFSAADPGSGYLQPPYKESHVPLFAIPTTAGTGSESTCHAVLYLQGEKQSVSHPGIVPDAVCLIPSVLQQLPLYQKKCTLLDALCQAIESWWSVNATPESIEYSRLAIQLIRSNWRSYIHSGKHGDQILLAANYAGRAISITATTAPHAMSYKLTSLYGLPHGHAVALAMKQVWAFMLEQSKRCPNSPYGKQLISVFRELPVDYGWFCELLEELEMKHPVSSCREKDLLDLAKSVNPLRLRNNPMPLDTPTLHSLYERIVG